MSDQSDNNSRNTSQDGQAEDGPLAGQRLAAARRANDISIAEVAKELHLDEPKVQALEENQFDVLGAPVFAKGHLKKYAELVGVDPDDVLADYYSMHRAVGAPPVVAAKHKKPREINLGPWIGIAVVLLIVGGAAYWWINRDQTPEIVAEPGTLEPFASEESVDADLTIVDMPAEETTDAAQEAAADTPAADAVDTGNSDAEVVVEEPVGADQLRIVMNFTGECWTEVTDANGNRLFFGLGQQGQTVTRAGTPPFQALFGDRNNVNVTVDGADIALTGGGRRGNTARVTIDAP